MRSDFAVFILTHGRPGNVATYKSIRAAGYTGKVFIVVDDEDSSVEEYRAEFGEQVLVFPKDKLASMTDEADNFQDRRSVIYARNACALLGQQVGVRFYIQLDDDYTSFWHLVLPGLQLTTTRMRQTLDGVFEALVGFLEAAPRIHTICLSQGGDHIGGNNNSAGHGGVSLRRKAMNSFVCRVTDREPGWTSTSEPGGPVWFSGRMNDDVCTFVSWGRRGVLFFTALQVMLTQLQTQSTPGGMTDTYLDSGTYVKSFYSVMFAPSCVQVGLMGDPRNPEGYRMHHKIRWSCAVPKILRDEHRKAAA